MYVPTQEKSDKVRMYTQVTVITRDTYVERTDNTLHNKRNVLNI